jgi:hypothetical protein
VVAAKHVGVAEHGNEDPESLIVRGWQRAGALVALFDPANGPLQNSNLAVPTLIYASKPVRAPTQRTGKRKGAVHKVGSKSERPLETITPLAKRQGLVPNLSCEAGQEKVLAAHVLAQSGTVLISWQHEKIPTIAKHIVGANPPTPPYPAKWPGDRFDIVWVFTPPASTSAPWGFVQVPQRLLPGDADTVISLMAPLRTAAK